MQLIHLVKEVLEELNENKVVLLKRGDVINNEDLLLYKKLCEGLEFFLTSTKEEQTYRNLQLNLLLKYETFIMDVTSTQEFPKLFQLFEYE